MQRFFFRALLIFLFVVLMVAVIGYARGYRFDTTQNKISSTGILAISSNPKAAKVYVNGSLKGVTDLNLTLTPGNYTIEIQKEGYASYKKSIVLKGELVETVDPVLFPINPSLTPLTNLGVIKAEQVDDSDKVIIFSQTGSLEKDGIYLFDASGSPLSFFPPLKTLLLKSNLPAAVDFSKAEVTFSNDFDQAVIDFPLEDGTTLSYLISLGTENQTGLDVTISKDTLVGAWNKDSKAEILKQVEALPKKIRKTAIDSFAVISFSPDQTKILYRASKNANLPFVINPPLIAANQTKENRDLVRGNIYVYDKREDKNYLIGGSKTDEHSVLWYSDSKRLVLKGEKQISISNYDGQDSQIVYSGPHEEGFVAVQSSGRLLVLANLNPQSNKFPDLYLVGIR